MRAATWIGLLLLALAAACSGAETGTGTGTGAGAGADAGTDAGGGCDWDECVLVQLAEGAVAGIALRGTWVYFVDAGDGAKGAGSVRRVPKDGGAVEVLVAGETRPAAVAVDDAYVYWVTAYTIDLPSAVRRAPRDGGEAATLFNSSQVDLGAIAVDADGLYFANRSAGAPAVFGIFPDNAAAQPISSDLGGATQMAIDGAHVYWIRDGALLRAPKVASFTPPEELQAPSLPEGLAMDADSVYWTDQGVFAAPKAVGGTVTTIAAAPSVQDPYPIAVDASGVYWGDLTPALGNAPAAGPARSFALPADHFPRAIALDEAAIYVAIAASGSGLYRLPK